MVPVLLILIPLLTGLGLFWVKSDSAARTLAFMASLASLCIMLAALTVWIAQNTWRTIMYGSASSTAVFILRRGMSKLLCLLTVFCFPRSFITAPGTTSILIANRFHALLMLSQPDCSAYFCRWMHCCSIFSGNSPLFHFTSSAHAGVAKAHPGDDQIFSVHFSRLPVHAHRHDHVVQQSWWFLR